MKIILPCLLFVGLGIVCAPAFLAYSYSIGKVDCVIVMVGDGTGGRFKGAEQLVEQGHSEVKIERYGNPGCYNELATVLSEVQTGFFEVNLEAFVQGSFVGLLFS